MGTLFSTLRPRQWLKNLVVFAPLVFAARFSDLEEIKNASAAFVILCLISGALYICNDLKDSEQDRLHPTKRMRPIASGTISRTHARIFAFFLIGIGLGLGYVLGPLVLSATLGFIAVNTIYILAGKNVAILDVMLIGASFVMRVLVGAAAVMAPASAWLLLTLFFLATYLGFTKRAGELKIRDIGGRVSLEDYSQLFLDHARSVTLTITLTLYTLYTFNSPYSPYMTLTVPFVFFGLLRYQAIVDRDNGANDGPSDHIYLDRSLQYAVIGWGITVFVIIGILR